MIHLREINCQAAGAYLSMFSIRMDNLGAEGGQGETFDENESKRNLQRKSQDFWQKISLLSRKVAPCNASDLFSLFMVAKTGSL